MVDSDPQCNLTGMVLGFKGADELESFYEQQGQNTISSGLAPAFEAQPRSISAVDTVEVSGRSRLHLLAGDLKLSEYEVTLGIAQELSAAIQALQNLPGSINFLIDETAHSIGADFVIVDMSPGLGAINQNLVSISDYIILPTSPDVFSVMALDSLSRVLPRWKRWAVQASSIPVLKEAAYPFPTPDLKVLGTVVQRFRPRKGGPVTAFKKWIRELDQAVENRLKPALAEADLLLPDEVYANAELDQAMALALIADFNSLMSHSQEHLTPVFALTEHQIGAAGTVLENTVKQRNSFHWQFEELSHRVELMTSGRLEG